MYDIAIIGGGPAGITAAIFAARHKLNAIIIAPKFGGKIEYAHSIENWPGDINISGEELAKKLISHAEQVNLKMVEESVTTITQNTNFTISTLNHKYKAEKILLAVGNEQNKLNIEGENEFVKKGVSYKANKDGKLFKDKSVAVIGSGDSACTSAIFLADIAKKVYLMYRSESLKAEPIWIDKIKDNQKIELLPGIMPARILGQDSVSQLICNDGCSLDVDGVFIEVGFSPPKFLVKELGIAVDEDGFIIVDRNQKTSNENIWAAGDITTNSGKLRQIVTAASEGAVAIASIKDSYTSAKY